MKIFVFLMLFVSIVCFGADNILNPDNGKAYLRDNTNHVFPIAITYSTDGSGNLHLINSADPVDDNISTPGNGGNAYLLGADGHTYPVQVVYTTDGNGNVIPIPSGGGGGGISSLNSQTGATQHFANDTNVTITSSSNTHSLGWTGTLSLARGGSGAALTASTNGVVYSDASKLNIASTLKFNPSAPSLTLGSPTQTAGMNSVSFGPNGADGTGSISGGAAGSRSSGNNSISWGFNCIATGNQGACFGDSGTINANDGFLSGEGNIVNGRHQAVVGEYNVAVGVPGTPAATDELFTVGNGANSGSRSTALSSLRNGETHFFNNAINVSPSFTTVGWGTAPGIYFDSATISTAPFIGPTDATGTDHPKDLGVGAGSYVGVNNFNGASLFLYSGAGGGTGKAGIVDISSQNYNGATGAQGGMTIRNDNTYHAPVDNQIDVWSEASTSIHAGNGSNIAGDINLISRDVSGVTPGNINITAASEGGGSFPGGNITFTPGADNGAGPGTIVFNGVSTFNDLQINGNISSSAAPIGQASIDSTRTRHIFGFSDNPFTNVAAMIEFTGTPNDISIFSRSISAFGNATGNATGVAIYSQDETNPSTSSKNLTYTTGNATGTTSDSGNQTFDTGTATGVKGQIFMPAGVTVNTSVSQPTCNVAHRGLMWIIQGGAAVADIFQICEKDATDTYVWTTH